MASQKRRNRGLGFALVFASCNQTTVQRKLASSRRITQRSDGSAAWGGGQARLLKDMRAVAKPSEDVEEAFASTVQGIANGMGWTG